MHLTRVNRHGEIWISKATRARVALRIAENERRMITTPPTRRDFTTPRQHVKRTRCVKQHEVSYGR